MTKPAVLSIAGHDPTGGAGVQADIEAIAAQGGHAVTLISALTVQDTRNVRRVESVTLSFLEQQAACLLADCQISAIKLGLLGEVAQIPLIAAWIRQLAVPVVLDPILRAGGGSELQGPDMTLAMQVQLFPLTTVLTPNAAEARRLTGEKDLMLAGKKLLGFGVANILITGGDEVGDTVENLWFQGGGLAQRFTWPRIQGGFHGAGCTLASALAARLALGESMATALFEAQSYTHRALTNSICPGKGRRIPGRWSNRGASV